MIFSHFVDVLIPVTFNMRINRVHFSVFGMIGERLFQGLPGILFLEFLITLVVYTPILGFFQMSRNSKM